MLTSQKLKIITCLFTYLLALVESTCVYLVTKVAAHWYLVQIFVDIGSGQSCKGYLIAIYDGRVVLIGILPSVRVILE